MRVISTPRVDYDLEDELGKDAACSLKFVFNRRPFCAKPAEWACQLSCCGHVKIVCDSHQDIATSVVPRIFICVVCRTENPIIVRSWRI